MGDVTKLYPANAAKYPDNVLDQCEGQFEHVLVIGWTKEGTLDFRSDTGLLAKDVNWAVDQFKFKLHRGDFSS